jgi:hypothetical protein
MGASINTVEEKKETPLDISKEAGKKVNAEENQ